MKKVPYRSFNSYRERKSASVTARFDYNDLCKVFFLSRKVNKNRSRIISEAMHAGLQILASKYGWKLPHFNRELLIDDYLDFVLNFGDKK